MTKPKTKLKPFKRVMWGLYSAHGHIQFDDNEGFLVSRRKSDSSTWAVQPSERIARVIVTIRPVAGRGKK